MFVRDLSRKSSLILLAAALLLAGCGGATPEPTLDVDAINTAAVATAMGQLSAQLTQTAFSAPSPTSSPTETEPTNTSVSGPVSIRSARTVFPLAGAYA